MQTAWHLRPLPLESASNTPLGSSFPFGQRLCGRRPRSRVGRDLIRANSLPSRAPPLQGAPNRPLRGLFPLCRVLCGRDARAPGWVPPATLFVRTASHSGSTPVARCAEPAFAGFVSICAGSNAGKTPALPGGALLLPRSRPLWWTTPFYPCSSSTISRAACLAFWGWSGGKEMAATTGCPPPP